MEIVYRDLSTIKPNPKNPRKSKPNAIVELAESIKNNPDYFEARPILLSDRTGELVIVGGERRSEAAAYLGMEKVPTILIPNLTEEKEDELMILDNVHSGVWDEKMLKSWNKAQLQKWGVELPKWDKPKKEVKEDDFNPDKKVKARCKFGELWQLGKHRLLCGDSTKAETFDQLLQGREARLVVTSPPYGVGKAYEKSGIEPWRNTIFAVIENITKHARIIVWNIGDLFATGTQFIEPTSMYSTEKMKQCGFGLMYSRIWKKPGGNFAGTNPYYTVSMKPLQEYEWILGYAKESYEKDYKPIIDYLANEATKAKLNNPTLKEITGAGFMYGHWFTSHQFALIDENNYSKISTYCKKANIDAFQKPYSEIRRDFDNLNIYGKVLTKEEESDWGQYAVWEISPVNARTGGHPAEFPVELPFRCIKMHSRPGDIILEPFCGAGTTLIAAEQLDRICYGVEYDPHYCDIIIERWKKIHRTKGKKN